MPFSKEEIERIKLTSTARLSDTELVALDRLEELLKEYLRTAVLRDDISAREREIVLTAAKHLKRE